MKKLLKSKMYLVGTLTMSIILFVSTGVQFWLTDLFYQRTKIRKRNGQHSLCYRFDHRTYFWVWLWKIFCYLGGYIINRRGGYENPTTVYVVFVFASIGIGCAVVLPFVDGFYIAAILLWIVLFFGGAMMPGLTGLMMVSVPPYL